MSIVGVDIGGTFTDLVAYRDSAIVTSKTLDCSRRSHAGDRRLR